MNGVPTSVGIEESNDSIQHNKSSTEIMKQIKDGVLGTSKFLLEVSRLLWVISIGAQFSDFKLLPFSSFLLVGGTPSGHVICLSLIGRHGRTQDIH